MCILCIENEDKSLTPSNLAYFFSVVQLTYEDNYFEIVYMISNNEGGNKIVFIEITDFLL